MGPAETPVTTAALVAVLIGQWLSRMLAAAPVTVPDFLLSLLTGLVLRNAGGLVGLRLHGAASDLIRYRQPNHPRYGARSAEFFYVGRAGAVAARQRNGACDQAEKRVQAKQLRYQHTKPVLHHQERH